MLCVIRKVMDAYILQVIYIKIPRNQFGFQKNTSIHDALFYLLNNIMSPNNPLYKNCKYFLIRDIAKVYDNFNCYSLLPIFAVINKYLAKVLLLLLICTVNILMLLGCLSSSINTTSGIPQGSPISPVLFNFVIYKLYNIKVPGAFCSSLHIIALFSIVIFLLIYTLQYSSMQLILHICSIQTPSNKLSLLVYPLVYLRQWSSVARKQ